MMFEHPWNIPTYDAESEKQSFDYRMKTQQVDWNEAPEWATCVVILKCNNKNNGNFYWSENPYNNARIMSVKYGMPGRMNDSEEWEVICYRGETPPQFNDDRLANDLRSVPLPPPLGENCRCTFTPVQQPSTVTRAPRPTPPSNCRCTFTPVQQPSTASDLLKQAEQLLTERGKQYDTSGQERSSAKIVAAFNTITGRDLTPGEGWLFLMLLKAVRFYSNTETPHRDSLEDLISYAALHAEEYLNDER